MNVIPMMQEILLISDTVIGESALPNFSPSTENGSQGVRVSALDKLGRTFKSYVLRGGALKRDLRTESVDWFTEEELEDRDLADDCESKEANC